jgi:sugar lactone lactonase YvrE
LKEILMRHGYSVLAASCLLGLGASAIQACGDDTSGTTPVDAGTDAVVTDATGPTDATGGDARPDGTTVDAAADARADALADASDGGADATLPLLDAGDAGDALIGDAGDAGDGGDAAAPLPSFLVHFSRALNQNPEGLWEIGDAGTPIVGLAPLATLDTVTTVTGAQPYATIGDAAAANTDTLGITTDSAGNIYVGVGVAAAGGPVPLPGVYKIPPGGGGAATLFAAAAGMQFPNGLDFIGNTLLVADSGGTIFAVDPAGDVSIWSNDALLQGNTGACDSGPPLMLGANGIVDDGNNVYVTNTNYGRIVKIPIINDGGTDGGVGTAGVASAILDNCTYAGADGIVLDRSNGTLIIAVNIQNKIVRVTQAGVPTVIASGSPLDSPASLYIDAVDGGRRLLFTNASFFSAADAGLPGLLALPIP